jgi:hypothetical protein
VKLQTQLDDRNKTGINVAEQNGNDLSEGVTTMIRLVREGMALASVSAFVWMMCTAAHLAA